MQQVEEARGRIRIVSRHRVLSGLAALLALNVLLWAPWAARSHADSPRGKDKDKDKGTDTVSLLIDYGDGHTKKVDDISWHEGMTGWDATLEAVRRPPAGRIRHTGSGKTVFVTEIDGVKNQGGGAGKKNWQYWVNGEYAKVGIGAKVLQRGDRVTWRFTGPPAKW